MPRLFRQSPLNGVWEGSGNVICLDVLRAMRREPESVEAFLAELDAAAGADLRYDSALKDLKQAMAAPTEEGARRLVERMAVLLQASLLLRHSPAFVSDAFVAARLGDPGVAYGALPDGVDVRGDRGAGDAGVGGASPSRGDGREIERGFSSRALSRCGKDKPGREGDPPGLGASWRAAVCPAGATKASHRFDCHPVGVGGEGAEVADIRSQHGAARFGGGHDQGVDCRAAAGPGPEEAARRARLCGMRSTRSQAFSNRFTGASRPGSPRRHSTSTGERTSGGHWPAADNLRDQLHGYAETVPPDRSIAPESSRSTLNPRQHRPAGRCGRPGPWPTASSSADGLADLGGQLGEVLVGGIEDPSAPHLHRARPLAAAPTPEGPAP